MNIRALKFGLPLATHVLAYLSFTQHGWMVFAPVLFVFFIVPSVELLVPSNEKNLTDAEEQIAKEDRLYDVWLYAIVPLQYMALYYFLQTVNDPSINNWELAGRILAMGLLCGTF
jgi:alkane 1-monooxygenase